MNYDIKLRYAWKKPSIIIKFTLQRSMIIHHWEVWRKPSKSQILYYEELR